MAIADYLDKPIGEIRLLHTRPARGKVSLNEHLNGDCIYYDSAGRGCTIYPVRPLQCRTWPFWPGNVSSQEAWEETARTCPGMGHGQLITLEEIENRINHSGT